MFQIKPASLRAILLGMCLRLGPALPASGASLVTDPGFVAPEFKTELFASPRVLVQPDGQILVFGRGFNTVNGIKTGAVARFKADGAKDESFAVGGDINGVSVLALDSDGNILIAASQAGYENPRKEILRRLSPSGVADPGFDAGPLGPPVAVKTIVALKNGKILLGGTPSPAIGATGGSVARLNHDGSVDTSFAPAPIDDAAEVLSMAATPDGKIYLGGAFHSVGGREVPGVARLNPNGSLDESFSPSGFSLDADTGSPTRGIAPLPDGSLLLGGRFLAAGNPTPRPLVRLLANGALDESFASQFAGNAVAVQSMVVGPDLRVYAASEKVWRHNPDGSIDPSFDHPPVSDMSGDALGDSVMSVGLEPDGKVVFAGNFTKVGDQPRAGVARADQTGSLDPWNTGPITLDVPVKKLQTQSSGAVLVRGDFTQVNGSPNQGFARLKPDGTLDNTFKPTDPTGDGSPVEGFAVQPDDKIIVFGGRGPAPIARLTAAGLPDPSFSVPPDLLGGVGAVLAQADGKLLASFANTAAALVAHPTGFIVRLRSDGSPDPDFHFAFIPNLVATDPPPGAPEMVHSPGPTPLVVLPSGGFVVITATLGLELRLLRFNQNGSADNSWQNCRITPSRPPEPGFDFVIDKDTGDFIPFTHFRADPKAVLAVAAQPDGKLLVAGAFNAVNGQPANGIVRLNANGSPDPTFNVGKGPQWLQPSSVPNLAPNIENIQIAGQSILVTGNFESFDDAPLRGVALLNANGSVNRNFATPVGLRNYGPYPEFPTGILIPQTGGSYLLAGRYGIGRGGALSVLRFSLILDPTGPPSLFNPRLVGVGTFAFGLDGEAGQVVDIEKSQDLAHWTVLGQAVIEAPPGTISVAAESGALFFRAVSRPK